jgi:hypothetical protein
MKFLGKLLIKLINNITNNNFFVRLRFFQRKLLQNKFNIGRLVILQLPI